MGKILSGLILIVGIAVFIFGNTVSQEAAFGNARISEAEETEDEGRRPTLGPVRRGIREDASENAEEKIGDAEQNVVATAVSAEWLQGAGIVLFVIGLGSLCYCVARKKS